MTISAPVLGRALVLLLAFLALVPEPAPAGTASSVLWTGDAEHSLSDQWAVGNAYDVERGQWTFTTEPKWASSSRVRIVNSPVAQGASAYAMTVKARDKDAYTSGAQRTELGQNNSARSFPDGVDRQMFAGQERWIAVQLRIPASYPAAAWNTLVQLKGAGAGNGPMAVHFEGGRLSLRKSSSQSYGSTSTEPVWTSPSTTVRDEWIKLLVHVRWSAGGDGFYELFGDLADGLGFRRLEDLTTGWTLKLGSDGGPVSVGARFGIYRAALAKDATAYFDGLTVAGDREGATVNAFGEPL